MGVEHGGRSSGNVQDLGGRTGHKEANADFRNSINVPCLLGGSANKKGDFHAHRAEANQAGSSRVEGGKQGEGDNGNRYMEAEDSQAPARQSARCQSWQCRRFHWGAWEDGCAACLPDGVKTLPHNNIIITVIIILLLLTLSSSCELGTCRASLVFPQQPMH